MSCLIVSGCGCSHKLNTVVCPRGLLSNQVSTISGVVVLIFHIFAAKYSFFPLTQINAHQRYALWYIKQCRVQPSAPPLFLAVRMLVNDSAGLVLSLFQPPSLESILWKNALLLPGCPSFLILVRAMQQKLGSLPHNSNVSTHPMTADELFYSPRGLCK